MKLFSFSLCLFLIVEMKKKKKQSFNSQALSVDVFVNQLANEVERIC